MQHRLNCHDLKLGFVRIRRPVEMQTGSLVIVRVDVRVSLFVFQRFAFQ